MKKNPPLKRIFPLFLIISCSLHSSVYAQTTVELPDPTFIPRIIKWGAIGCFLLFFFIAFLQKIKRKKTSVNILSDTEDKCAASMEPKPSVQDSMKNNGFTIIELLVVVSIIMILSAIAVENMMLAQVRTKVSRNLTEFRTLATAIETYTVDHRSPPRMAHWKFYQDPERDKVKGQKVNGILSNCLSTPVAYITNAYLMDPFMERNLMAPIDERNYTYQVLGVYKQKYPNSPFWPVALEYYGQWRIGAVGPDQTFDHGFTNSAQLPYDPTNGTISLGNLWYSQKVTEQKLPPMPDLLREH